MPRIAAHKGWILSKLSENCVAPNSATKFFAERRKQRTNRKQYRREKRLPKQMRPLFVIGDASFRSSIRGRAPMRGSGHDLCGGYVGILVHRGFWLVQASFAILAPRKLGDPFLVGRKTDHGVLHVAQGYL